MKINIEIDMTADEARTMLGLPDLKPMQATLTARLEEKMVEALDDISHPDYLFKRFMPLGVQGFEHFQKMTEEVMAAAKAKNAQPSPTDQDK